MPQASAPSPLGSLRRSASPHDGPGTGRGEGRALHGDPTAPTHTVVFFPPVLGGAKPRPGRGLVLDAQGSVTSKFTAGASADMIGACGGLICLLDARTCAVRISNPATGESLDLPPPPSTSARRDPRAYCFGFDAAATRRYKIVHLPDDDYKICQSSASSSSRGTRVVYVHSVGDKYWKPVRVPGAAACCLAAGGGVYSDGAVYWLTHHKVAMARLVRFDLTEEAVSQVELPPFDAGRRRPLYCRLMDADGRPCVVTSLRHDPRSGEPASSDDVDVWRLGEDGQWPGRPCGVQLRRQLPRHVPAGPQAVRRGHVLLQGEDGALYAHRVKDGAVPRIERGAGEKVLVEGSSSRDRTGGAKQQQLADAASPCGRQEQIARAKRESVIPTIMGVVATRYLHRLKKTDQERDLRQAEKAREDGPVHEERGNVVRTFGYVQPVSNASLAQLLGLGGPRWTHGGMAKGPVGRTVTPSSAGSVSRSCTPCNPWVGAHLLLQDAGCL